MSLIYFDSNVCIGKRGYKNRREIWKSEDVLSSMDRTGISAALVYSGWARDYAPIYGNERLAEELQKHHRFYGCYTIAPGYTGSFLMPYEFIEDMRRKKMIAVTMFPALHCFSPSEDVMGEYYNELEKNKIPLLVEKAQISWGELSVLLANHPALNIVLLGTSWTDFNNLAAYMKRYSNLYADLSTMQANYGVEVIAKEIGADRVCFGSGLPKMNPGAARAFIDYAQISEEEKKLMSGGNLARLCGIDLPAEVEVKSDEIAKQAALGKPLDVFVFDSHAHFLEDNGNCGAGWAMINGDLPHMSKLSDAMGVDEYCVAPWLGIWTDSEAGNKIVSDMARRDKRVYPYVLIDPNYVADVEREAYHYHIEEKMPGMKMFYSRTGVRYNDPAYEPWLKIANDNRLFALMDSGNYPSYLSDMEELAEKYPDITFFLDHAGRNFPCAEQYAQLAKKYDNVYLQLTYTTVPEGVIEYFCAEGLVDKVLYGTDAPMRDPRPQLGWVVYSNISVEDKKKILGENMRRIAQRCFKN
ncbi:MAG: amidohydrolase family protein [Oscillospiraceae bacterium]|nr:amidohydrolase family protein [Oscillospiraceae bacterium]MBQ3225386.1 amidohydrolase family protein [Oscillospiraceae bacterium]MBQ7054070.1 amidohydrolase family protein [Oscillospiraceae bacterium]